MGIRGMGVSLRRVPAVVGVVSCTGAATARVTVVSTTGQSLEVGKSEFLSDEGDLLFRGDIITGDFKRFMHVLGDGIS
jgi:hypothetical protein